MIPQIKLADDGIGWKRSPDGRSCSRRSMLEPSRFPCSSPHLKRRGARPQVPCRGLAQHAVWADAPRATLGLQSSCRSRLRSLGVKPRRAVMAW